jgi:hypothetical protein
MMPVRRPRPSEAGASVTGSDGAAAPSSANAPSDARATATSGQSAGNAGARPSRNPLPMKIFFALVSLSLLMSTLTGLYMAWRYSRKPKLVGALLLAGIFVPIMLTLL